MTVSLASPQAERLFENMPTPEMKRLADKVVSGQRLSPEEGLALFDTPYAEALRQLADYRRHEMAGDTVHFASTLYIHPTNLCELSCPMCSFYAKPGWDTAWFLEPSKIIEKVKKEHAAQGLTEVHVVGGLWRDCDLDYYQEMFTGIKSIDPQIHIKALTPVEYDFLAKQHEISITEVFERMMSWGLGSLPGGGAEVLVEEIRKKLAPQKITSDEYLDIHRIAHGLGLPSGVTLLFGSIEEHEHIITHLCRVRELQDSTGGFIAFVPLKYHDENNALGKRKGRLKPKDIKRVYAISRLMLDNVPSLKCLWNYLGVDDALELLRWGGNDMAATQMEEKIIVMAGGVQIEMTREKMGELIRGVGRLPFETNSSYRAHQREG
jgi:CofH subfamily radical SAM domain protein